MHRGMERNPFLSDLLFCEAGGFDVFRAERMMLPPRLLLALENITIHGMMENTQSAARNNYQLF